MLPLYLVANVFFRIPWIVTPKSTLSQKFLSLHGKWFCALSFLILSICGVFAALNYENVVRNFQAQQQESLSALQLELIGVVKQAADRIERYGAVLFELNNLDRLSRNGQSLSTVLQKRLARHLDMQYQLDMVRVELFTSRGTSIWQWPSVLNFDGRSPRLSESLNKAIEHESSVSLLSCHPGCGLHVFLPLLDNNQLVGVIEMEQQLSDLIIDFKTITEADIAILTRNEERNEAPGVASWSGEIAGMSNSEMTQGLIHYLAQKFPTVESLNQNKWVSWNGRRYNINAVSINEIFDEGNGYVLFIRDVTSVVTEFEKTNRRIWMVTGIAALFGELLLLLLIRTPLIRLNRLAMTLPLLAKGDYIQVRKILAVKAKKYRLNDEVDILEKTAIRLSYQIEDRDMELTADRDFIQGLFDTAKVSILTQSENGQIHSANDCALKTLDLTESELKSRCFSDLLAEAEQQNHYLQCLVQLLNGERERLEHEVTIRTKDGSLRHVVWVHSKLHNNKTNDLALLSVGLDVTDRIQAESRVRWLANHDALTSLYNRTRFYEELENTLAYCDRGQHKAAVLMFDIDHFKDVNDSSGHAAGDALLIMLANELHANVRKSDIIARLGGDEFAILLRNETQSGAEAMANNLNQRLGDQLFQFNNRSYRISLSIGIVILPDHGSGVEEVMANVDMAMYQAKKAGRGRAHIFTIGHDARAWANERIYWRNIITRSLNESNLVFHYQPIVCAKTRQIEFYEALLRIKLDDGRLAFPGEFLGAAQRLQLTYAIDAYVTNAVCKILTENRDVVVSINLSASALSDHSWATPLKQAVEFGVLNPKQLHFEITETAAISDMAAAQAIIENLSKYGFKFALDDFGSGYSSFYYLKNLPVTYVKIDQSFVSGLKTDKGDKVFITALTTLAHGYGQKVVAEGVEDPETFALLQELGVDYIQGFYVGRPSANFT